MKTKLLILLVLFFMMSFFGCSKDGDDSSGSTKMTATIDGSSWSTAARITVKQGNRFIITGTSLTGQSLVITVNGTSTGSYSLSVIPVSAGCGAVYKGSLVATTDDAFLGITGDVTLSEVNTSNKTISGTFSFTMRRDFTGESMSISNGVFNNLLYTVASE